MSSKQDHSVKARIGLYSVGLKAYWSQFDGLKDRLLSYGHFIASKIQSLENVDVFYFGMVDDENSGREAGHYFNERNVDVVFLHSATYATGSCILPVHQICRAPIIILNLQPSAKVNYDKTTTGEWLAHCGACPVPEFSYSLNRAGIKCHIVNGLLGLDKTSEISLTNEVTCDLKEAIRAWESIREWVKASIVKHTLASARFGFLGNTYSGMLDMYSDFTAFQIATGSHVEILEMCDLANIIDDISDDEIQQELARIHEFFVISEGGSADPIAEKPTEKQLKKSAKISVALRKLVESHDLDSLTYYYHGSPRGEYEDIQANFIVGGSILTAQRIPCAGEGDLKTNLAMKIADICNVGGSYSEIVVVDYDKGTILCGHDGPFHLKIADGKPILRSLNIFHGKQGCGVSVEAKVKSGKVTTLGCTQTRDGNLKFIISEGFSENNQIMSIGNTQTHIRFNAEPDEYMDKWFKEAPTHHFAMSLGHNAGLFQKAAEILDIEYAII